MDIKKNIFKQQPLLNLQEANPQDVSYASLEQANHNSSKSKIIASTLAFLALTVSGCSINKPQQKVNQTPKVQPTALPKNNNSNELLQPQWTQNNPHFTLHPTWLQDFSKSSSLKPNPKFWNTYVGKAPANNEAEYYTNNKANIRISKGRLVLEALQQNYKGYNYTSARISTRGSFLYGKLVINATFPLGVGTWPAIWMLPTAPKYKNEPNITHGTYINGEIDIAEAIGFYPNEVYGIAHKLNETPQYGQYAGKINLPNNNSTYYQYGIDWTPNHITYTVNNKPYFEYKKPTNANYTNWPFNHKNYLIINLAMGGAWGGIDRAQYPPQGINNNVLPAEMQVKSVAYYPYVSTKVAP